MTLGVASRGLLRRWPARGVLAGVLAGVLVVLSSSWLGASELDRDRGLELFERRVRPLLVERCHRCHSESRGKRRGGLVLDSAAGLARGGDSGPVVVPGRPEASALIHAVRYDDADLSMPPDGKLDAGAIAALEQWIALGAPFPGARDEEHAEEREARPDPRSHWAFRPLRGGDERGVDEHLDAALAARGVRAASPADRRTLARRLAIVLTGLPLSPEDVEAFESDEEPEAVAKLVDRLLATVAFGERFGRSWLDRVRYSDATAPWLQTIAGAWLYRDWVVRALAEDLPWDEFVLRQFAADLLDDTESADNAALGLIGLSPEYWKELQLAPDVIRTVIAEEWEERIDAVSRTFLGLTVACARCHDHKFDPISQADYYALAGVFASIRRAELPVVPAPEAERARLARERVAALLEELEGLGKGEGDARATERRVEIRVEVAALESTPHFHTPLANAIEDASVWVLADGPNRTRIEHRPGVARDLEIQLGGSPARLGEVVPRRFLTVLSSGEPRRFHRGSGRLDLARAIVEEGRPLAARVHVNRVWRDIYGAGLVATPSNFGARGEPPSHPELLDALAARWVSEGWSTKRLARELAMTRAFARSASRDVEAEELDPENRLLWRAVRRRLDVEVWRDSMLAASGELERAVGGPPAPLGEATNRRRTLYAKIDRRDLDRVLSLWDYPDPTAHSPGRSVTTTPLQGLFVLNADFLHERAQALADRLERERVSGVEERLDRASRLLFSRPPMREESRAALAFLEAARDEGLDSRARWTRLLWALLGSHAAYFVE